MNISAQRTGDIILVKTNQKHSKANIAGQTIGSLINAHFSHAILVVSPGTLSKPLPRVAFRHFVTMS